MHVSTEDGELFDISFDHGDVSFTIFELTKKDFTKLLADIGTQMGLLEKFYKDLEGR